MAAKESAYPLAWIAKVDTDIRAAEQLLEGQELSIAAFHIQQAIEKHLKGYPLHYGWQLRRIHELEVLLNEAVAYDPALKRFQELCAISTEYYVTERYPYEEIPAVSREMLEQQIAQINVPRGHITAVTGIQ